MATINVLQLVLKTIPLQKILYLHINIREVEVSFDDFCQLQTNFKYLEFILTLETNRWYQEYPSYNFVKFFQKILEINSNLKTFFVNDFMSKEESMSISDLESFWRVVLQHPSLGKYIFPASKKLLQAREKIMKELKLQFNIIT